MVEQVVEPSFAEYFPAGQATQLLLLCAYEPALQVVQALDSATLTSPAAHLVHDADESRLYVPALQEVQVDTSLRYLPAAQATQEAEPALEMVPAEQVLHSDAPETPWYLPAGQAAQLAAPAPE